MSEVLLYRYQAVDGRMPPKKSDSFREAVGAQLLNRSVLFGYACTYAG